VQSISAWVLCIEIHRELERGHDEVICKDALVFEAKAVEKLTDSHLQQVFNYLAASKLRVGLLVNFGGDVLECKRVIL
jgi:GxxExxY protein